MKTLGLLTAVCLLGGCAWNKFVPLTPAEQNVRTLYRTDAPLGCKDLGSVKAVWKVGYGPDDTRNLLKRLTHERGGNVLVYGGDGSGTFQTNDEYGQAYDCPQKTIRP